MTDYRCDHGYYAMGRDCPTCQKERDEARAEVARLRHDPKADARQVIEEWRAKAERAWSDATWAQEQRVAMLALLKQCRTHLPTPRRNDTPYGQLVAAVHAAIAGQPAPKSLRVRHADGEDIAPVTPVVDDVMVDRAQTAYTDAIVKSLSCNNDTMKEHPMHAALVAALEGRT